MKPVGPVLGVLFQFELDEITEVLLQLSFFVSEQESLVAVINPPGVTLVLRRPLLVILNMRQRTKSTTALLCKEFNQKVSQARVKLCVETGWGQKG